MSPGVSLAESPTSHALGDPRDPPVVLVDGAGMDPAACAAIGATLAEAGRYVITVDIGADKPGSPQRVTAGADELRAMLRGLSARPVVVAASLGGIAAILALGEKSHAIATGLVLVDVAPWLSTKNGGNGLSPRMRRAAGDLQMPTLLVEPGDEPPAELQAFHEMFSQVEISDATATRPDGGQLSAEALGAIVLEFVERCAPLAPLAYEAGEAPNLLRNALGCFATGVTIVTTRDGDRPVGVTANSFTSVSLDPPLVLVSLARTATSLPVFERAQTFAINVLNVDQQASASQFASRVEDRFAGVAWEASDSGPPILTGSLASFECEKYAVHDGGDHRILIGKVLRARFAPPRDPLVFYRGKFRRLHLG